MQTFHLTISDAVLERREALETVREIVGFVFLKQIPMGVGPLLYERLGDLRKYLSGVDAESHPFQASMNDCPHVSAEVTSAEAGVTLRITTAEPYSLEAVIDATGNVRTVRAR